MVPQEFKAAIANHNLLRTRIMLKDSFIVDPTFSQLKEMLAYAMQTMPELLVPFDGETLEENPAKWNQEVMNMELVQLVNNFSEPRIAHLKKVVSKVMDAEIQKAKIQKRKPPYQCPQQNLETPLRKKFISNPCHINTAATIYSSEESATKALQRVMAEGNKISRVIQEVKDTKKWELSQINELEKAARQLLQAAQIYKANRKNR